MRAALPRRTEPEPFQLGDLAIGYDERRVTVGDRPVELTATEFELLRVLSIKAGRVVTYISLLRQAWGGRDQGSGDPEAGARGRQEATPQAGRGRGSARLHPQ